MKHDIKMIDNFFCFVFYFLKKEARAYFCFKQILFLVLELKHTIEQAAFISDCHSSLWSSKFKSKWFLCRSFLYHNIIFKYNSLKKNTRGEYYSQL